MKFFTALIIIVGLTLGARQVYQYYGKFKTPEPAAESSAGPAEVPEDQLPGLPPSLQPALDEAREHGATGMLGFLAANARAIHDPRRASLELDYVVLITSSNPAEACRIFAKVKARLEPNSPVYGRMKKLEKTYE